MLLLLPAQRGEVKRIAFSRRVFLRVRVMSKLVRNKSLASEPGLRQINPVVVTGFITAGFSSRSPGFSALTRATRKKKKEAERRETDRSVLRASGRGSCPHPDPPRVRGREGRGQLASRRSTAVLAKRLSPPCSAPGQASWDVAGAYDPMDRQPGRRSYALSRALSAPACPSPGKSPPAPVVMPAGVMPEAAREQR
jgi:hypothetical protein